MSDILDAAQRLEEQERDRIIREASEAVHAAGCADCEDCGDHINEARRRAHPAARRCLPCQRAIEARAYLGRGA